MTHPTEEQLVLYYYGEGDGSPGVRDHLDTCETCRAEYANLQRVLNVVDSAPVPERAADYGAQAWNRVQPMLGSAKGRAFPRRHKGEELRRMNSGAGRPVLRDLLRSRRWILPVWWPARHWAAAAAVAMLMVAAFLAGRYYPKAQPPQTAGAAQVRERILLVAVGDHLDRSQVVLVELVNAQPGQPLDITSERARAEDLVAANRLYRQTAVRAGDARVAGVLDELEPVLLEIAHSPGRLTPEESDQLRERIAGAGILFKVRVAGSAVRQREQKAVRDAGRATL